MSTPHPGAYERLITDLLARRLAELPAERIGAVDLTPDAAEHVLADHLERRARRALASIEGSPAERLNRQIALANRVAAAIDAHSAADDHLSSPARVLHEVLPPGDHPGPPPRLPRPLTPLSRNALLVNGIGQPRIGAEIARELPSADRVDLLCAFITWPGVRVLDEALRAFMDRPGARLRVITTTYMGATQRRAIDHLSQIGAQVRISYHSTSTRLHAKSWLFHRDTGHHTAYVGSSNLSRAALTDGLEWNIRLGTAEPGLLATCAATFNGYWGDPGFEPYDASDPAHTARLDAELARNGGRRGGGTAVDLAPFEVRPHPFQQGLLDDLDRERRLHGRTRNLLVMATGTGKTVVAGLDYRRLRDAGQVRTLLFVAHRSELLTQARATFARILHDPTFGELLVGGERPRQWSHVFASVQSLAQIDLAADLPSDRFDMVVVDEFHHAAARTYARLLEHLNPRQLLGLTATPERGDGEDILHHFGGRTATELRLWEALDRGLLAPFQYFGVHDGTDLTRLGWRRGRGYDPDQLNDVYTGDDARVAIILRQLTRIVADVGHMRALGFCVSVDHARFMARRFREAGIAAHALAADTATDQRRQALEDLRDGRVAIVFAVDLLNEGVDIPAVDTILFLRPTDSATIFLQQLGRGLRPTPDKPCLTVLDFIGHQHQEFRFDRRLTALTGRPRRELEGQIEQGFPTLPAGCHIWLDRLAAREVLDNVRRNLNVRAAELARYLRELEPVDLAGFLELAGLDLADLYRGSGRTWTDLRRLAGVESRPPGPHEGRLGRAFARLLHTDDRERLDALAAMVEAARTPGYAAPASERDLRLATMAHHTLWGVTAPPGDRRAGIARLAAEPARRDELGEIVAVLRNRQPRLAPRLTEARTIPVHLHARYSRDEALAAFGVANPGAVREGVRWVEHERADILFVTLDKSAAEFSPTTMYDDRALAPDLFQWESQNATSPDSPVGRRYISHAQSGSQVHLFLRPTKRRDGHLGPPPYLYAGPCTYVSHRGARPMRIIWRLAHPLPPDVFRISQAKTG